jgi:hypothetical protein
VSVTEFASKFTFQAEYEITPGNWRDVKVGRTNST